MVSNIDIRTCVLVIAVLISQMKRTEFTEWSIWKRKFHYGHFIMSTMASQITRLTIVYSSVYSGADQRKHQWKLCVAGLCEGNSPTTGELPHKWPVTRKMFPFGDVFVCKLFDIVMKVSFQRHFLLWSTSLKDIEQIFNLVFLDVS